MAENSLEIMKKKNKSRGMKQVHFQSRIKEKEMHA